MTELRRLAMAVVILGSALTGPLGAMAAGPDASGPDRELVLGLRVTPPFALKTPAGIWTGISVELWRHLAEQLRLRFRFEETTQEGLLKGLADGTLDASGGALTVTAERLREVDFALPYFVTGLGVAVPLRASLDWTGVAASFLSIRFLSVVAVFNNNVALVNADTKLDAIVARCGGITLDHAALPFSHTTQCINHTGKFDQQAITSRFDNAAPVFGDLGINQVCSQRLEPVEGSFLIRPDQPRIPRHIGGEDRGKTARCGHAISLVTNRRPDSNSSR